MNPGTTAAKTATRPAAASKTAAAPVQTASMNTTAADNQEARNERANALQEELTALLELGQTMPIKDFFDKAGLDGFAHDCLLNGSGYPYITAGKAGTNVNLYLSKGLAIELMGGTDANGVEQPAQYDIAERATSTGKNISVLDGLDVPTAAFLSGKTITLADSGDGVPKLKVGRTGEGAIEIVKPVWA